MPKVNVYLPDDLAEAVREADIPISAVCQQALEQAVRNMKQLGNVKPTGVFGRFTDEARQIVVRSQDIAREHRHSWIGPEHLLLAALESDDGSVARILPALNVSALAARAGAEEAMPRRGSNPSPERLPFTKEAKAGLEIAYRESLRLKSDVIGAELLLLALLIVRDTIPGRVLGSLGVTAEQVRRQLQVGIVRDSAAEGLERSLDGVLDQLTRLNQDLADARSRWETEVRAIRDALRDHGIDTAGG